MGQRMFIFERDHNGQMIPYAEWRVSTGREQWEDHKGKRGFTATPEGVFRLEGDKLTRYARAEGLHDIRARIVRELKDGRMLVGTQDGVYELRAGRMYQLGLHNGLHPDLDVTAISGRRFTNTEACAGFYVDWEPAPSR